MFRFLRKKPRKRKRAVRKKRTTIEAQLSNVCTKDDVKQILQEIASSREVIVQEVSGIPASLSALMADQVTSPLKDFFAQQLRSNQAVKQLDVKQLSSNQAVKQLDDVVEEMRKRIERLSQRHMKILNVLLQNRGVWMSYEEIGHFCNPQLTGSCIRGYVADLINSYSIPIEKRNAGRKGTVKLSPQALKQLALSRLGDEAVVSA